MTGVFYMEIYQAIILGAVQGITEFLPISSSGHLALCSALFGLEGDLLFGIILHVATLLPVIFVHKKELFSVFSDKKKLLCLVVATIPAGVVGLIFSDLVDEMFINIKMLSWTFFTTALMLISCRFVKKKDKSIGLKQSLIYGAFQAFAIFPGVSRSGSTLTAGKFAGVEEKENIAFAFIMSVPIILASLVLESLKVATCAKVVSIGLLPMIFGFLSALVFGFIFALIMKKFAFKSSWLFSVYLIILSSILLIWKI